MKISEMTTEQAYDKLCLISPIFENIIKDEKIKSFFQDKIKNTKNNAKNTDETQIIEKIFSILPDILKEHKSDVFNIVAILNDKDIEEVYKQNIGITISEIKEIIKDEDLISFFK